LKGTGVESKIKTFATSEGGIEGMEGNGGILGKSRHRGARPSKRRDNNCWRVSCLKRPALHNEGNDSQKTKTSKKRKKAHALEYGSVVFSKIRVDCFKDLDKGERKRKVRKRRDVDVRKQKEWVKNGVKHKRGRGKEAWRTWSHFAD